MKSTLTERIGTRITTQFHGLIVEHLGQKDGLAFGQQIVDELTGADLVGQGVIGHHHAGIAQPLFQAGDNRERQFIQLLLGELSLRVAYL